MIAVTLAVVLLAAVAIATGGSLLRSLVRQHARERDLMLNQIMHLADHTWSPPPAAEPKPKPEPRTTVRSPEQEPDGALA